MAAEEHVENEENSEKSLKRKREPSVLDNFTKLTNGLEKVRIKSGVDLLKHLTENKTEKTDNELKYAFGRLIRGLGSSKIHAKTGFFSALVALLNLKNISVDEILEHVSKELHKGGGNSKSENADVCSGQILVAGAILRSNLYETCDDTSKTKVLELLLKAGKERTYLNLASYRFLIDLFAKIESKEFEKLVFPLLKDELAKPWAIQNLDSLYLLIEVQRSFPQSLHTKFLKNNLGTAAIVSPESLKHVCNTLTTIPRVLALKHPIFELFIKIISESDMIVQFFEELDHTLTRSNRNKHFAVTKLLTGVLENLKDPTIIPVILTKNYIQQIINTYKTAVGKQKDKEFHESSQKLFDTLLNSLKQDSVKSKIKIKILKKLLFYPGTFIFEKVTKSKVIQNITSTLNTEGVKKLGAIYRDVVLATVDKVVNENTTEQWWNVDRVYASHLLVKLTNHPSVQTETEWKIEQLVFLGQLGLLRGQSKTVGNELADSLKETFYSSLDLKLSKLDDLRLILSSVFNTFDEMITEDNLNTILREPLTEENYETWKKTVQLAKKLEGSSKKKSSVFHTLFLHLGLQIFNNAKLAADSLTELFSCYERTKKSKKSQTETISDDPLWIEVVIDLFLNLLSHNSHLLRRVINCVFPHLCKYMNATAIHQILSVLDPKNETNPLSKSNEDSEDDDDDDDEEKKESDETDEEDEDAEEEEEEEDDDETVNDKLRMALHQALGANADSDAESIDLDNLDDEEGEKLNEVLGQAFKQFKPNLGKNKKQKKDDEALTHFRIRVLDVIEIYLNSSPSMLLTLEIMLPLLQCLEFCIKDDHQKPLQDRVKACLKKLSLLKKFSECEDVTEEILIDLLKSLLEKGDRNVIIIQEMGEKIAECCLFVISCSQILRNNRLETETPKKKHKNRVALIIKESLEAFFTRRDCVIPYVLFKNVLQLNWEGILSLVPHLSGFVFAHSVRPFRRNQAIELLKIFYHNQRFIGTHTEEVKKIEDITVNFLRDCVDFFRNFNANPTERKVKEKFICNLFELLTSVKTSVLGKSFEGWDLLGDSIRECRSQVTFLRNTKSAFTKLCKSLNISNIVQMKQETVKLNNVEDDAGNEVEENGKQEGKEKQDKKKKKKNLNKEKLKLKKETKALRLQSLSEGFNKRKFQWEDTDENKKVKVS